MGTTKTYNCLNCDAENKWTHQKSNKYCNNTCQQEHFYKTKHIPLILEGKKGFDSAPLKRYILERDNCKCTECGLGQEYNGKPLTLQLDHIDGDSDNNMPDNLRILCPNCHAQTDNHGSKGFGSRYKKQTRRNKYLRKYKTTGL